MSMPRTEFKHGDKVLIRPNSTFARQRIFNSEGVELPLYVVGADDGESSIGHFYHGMRGIFTYAVSENPHWTGGALYYNDRDLVPYASAIKKNSQAHHLLSDSYE